MSDNTTHESEREERTVVTDGGRSDVEREKEIDYLDVEINLLKPGTPFMRDHNRVILTGFFLWAIIVFGPVTATRLAPDLMTQPIPGLGFPLHYFLIAVGGPGGALLLSVWYVRKRDKIDEKYGIEQVQTPETTRTDTSSEPAATDGGVDR
ncbi:DUF4212 domain-containing protein [Saliphagus sp. GCM10025334]